MLRLMTQPADLETRVASLETQVSDLRDRVRRTEQDAAAARVLAGGVDRDVTEIRAEIREFREHNIRLLNAMRADLVDLRGEMTDLRGDMNETAGSLRGEMNDLRLHVDDGFIEMRGRLDAAAAGQQQIVDMLNMLISQSEDE